MKDIILFHDKDNVPVTYEHLLKKIYDNHEEKKSNILATVSNISPLIKTLNDAVILMPTLTHLQEIAIKNDDQLLKMAAIIQRSFNKKKTNDTDEFILSDSEKDEIIKAARLAASNIPSESK